MKKINKLSEGQPNWATHHTLNEVIDAVNYLIDRESPTIIAEPLEAKELWGVKARVMNNIIGTWFWVECGGLDSSDMFISTKCEPTEAAAITAWNQLVDKIQGER